MLHSLSVTAPNTTDRPRALVTGGARRLGMEIAVCLADAGFAVDITYHRSESTARNTLARLGELGSRSEAFPADLSLPADRDRLVDWVFTRHGRGPTVLVNSAMGYPRDDWRGAAQESILEAVSLGAVAPLDLSRKLMGKGAEGSVVNLLDARVHDYDRHHFSYSSAKKLLFEYTRVLALELAPSVRVNALAPGFLMPPEGLPSETVARLERANPLRRRPALQDLLDGLLYVVHASSVTGQVLYVDGGRHLTAQLNPVTRQNPAPASTVREEPTQP